MVKHDFDEEAKEFDKAKEFFVLEKGYVLKSQTEENIIFESQKREWGGGSIIILIFGVILFLFLNTIIGILLIILAVILHFGKSQPSITGSKIGKKIAWTGSSENTNNDVREFIRKQTSVIKSVGALRCPLCCSVGQPIEPGWAECSKCGFRFDVTEFIEKKHLK